MKYLVQNTKEFFITILLFIVYAVVLVWAIWAIVNGEFDFKNFLSIIGAIISYFGWYFNMPTSEENCRHTGEMRHEKDEKSEDYVGERIYGEDPEEIEDGGDVDDDF